MTNIIFFFCPVLSFKYEFCTRTKKNNQSKYSIKYILCSYWTIWNTSTEIVLKGLCPLSQNQEAISGYRNMNQLYKLLGTTFHNVSLPIVQKESYTKLAQRTGHIHVTHVWKLQHYLHVTERPPLSILHLRCLSSEIISWICPNLWAEDFNAIFSQYLYMHNQ